MKTRCAFVALVLVVSFRLPYAQSTSSTAPSVPAYEVTSVKPNQSGDYTAYLDAPPGTFRNVSLKAVIEYAYSVPDDQFSGGPAWIETEHFDILGKMSDADAAAYSRLATRQQEDERKGMLQQLLADRFALKVSHHPKEISGYALVIAKSGLKIRPSGKGGPESRIPSCELGCAMAATDPMGTVGALTDALSRVLGRSVVNATGLKGTYDIQYVVPSQPNGDQEDLKAAIRQAMEDQLGLKVESRRISADTIRVDSVEKPSPN